MTEKQIKDAREITQTGFMMAKEQGVAEQNQPRSGFDAANIHLGAALRQRGVERRRSIGRAVSHLVNAAGAVGISPSLRGQIKEAFHTMAC